MGTVCSTCKLDISYLVLYRFVICISQIKKKIVMTKIQLEARCQHHVKKNRSVNENNQCITQRHVVFLEYVKKKVSTKNQLWCNETQPYLKWVSYTDLPFLK